MPQVGRTSVEIEADTAAYAASLRRDLAHAGRTGGQAMDDAIQRQVRDTGQHVARRIGRDVTRTLARIRPKIQVQADMKRFEQQVRSATRLRPVSLPVTADMRSLRRSITGRGGSAQVSLTPETSGLGREVQRAVGRIGPITIPIQADASAFRASLRSLPTPSPVMVPVRADTSGGGLRVPPPPPVPVRADTGGVPSAISGAISSGAAAGVAAAAAVLTAGLKGAIETIEISASFEAEMNKVKALTGTAGASFESLNAKAKELGSSTKYSAAEAAGGMQELGKAGLSANQILAAVPDVLNLATAAGIDMSDAANHMTNAMAAFQIPAKDAGKVTDEWAAIVSKANADIPGLAAGLANVGAAASLAGLSLADTSRALATMTDAGIPAADAGTALRNVVDGLSKGGGELDKVLQKNNIALKDSAGKTRPLVKVIRDLATSNISAADSQKVFGIEGKKALDVIGLNIDKFDQLGKAADNSSGATQKMADIMGSGAQGSMANFKAALEGLAITIGDTGLLAGFTKVTESLSTFVQALSAGDAGQMREIVAGWVDSLGAFADMAVAKIAEWAPKVIAAMFKLGQLVGNSIDRWGPLLLKALGGLASITSAVAVLLTTIFVGVAASLGEQLLGLVQGAWGHVADFFTETIPGWAASLGSLLMDALGSLGEVIGGALGAAFEGVVGFFTSLPGMILSALAALPGLLLDLFVNAVAGLGIVIITALVGIAAIFFKLPTMIANALVSLGALLIGAFSRAFSAALSAVTSFISSAASFFASLPGRIGSALATLPGQVVRFFRSAGTSALGAARSFGSSVVSFFASLPGRIGSALASLGGRIAGVFRSAASSARSAVSSLISGIVSAFTSLPGKIIAAIGDIGGRIISKIKSGLPSVVQKALPFADGGIVTAPVMGLVGEAGPEVVIPLSRPRRAAELAEQSGLLDMLGRQRGTGGGGAQITNNWNINSRMSDPMVLAQHLQGRIAVAAGV
ncbi:phage tail tape measure protein [Streptomyces sulphureus]|uniref:phage tail tape measure protein n=1 Tax=Streptomyces sulphureus TaxID=47758 RepID=UPI000367A38A|nr:phage tail tape measure protein [Streptomyces sulphureus]